MQSLEALALESDKICQELITVLLSLKATENTSRYKSFPQAVKTIWNSAKIKDTKRRLDAIQASIQLRIQVLIREDQFRNKDEILQALDEASRSILLASLRDRDEIMKRQQASDALATARHDHVVDLIKKTRHFTEGTESKDVLARIKAQLYHRRQTDRFDDIVDAHHTTFQWVLQENHSSNTTWPDLHAWLRDGQGIYWLSGKAGSGKSTLMKYLHQAPALRATLESWAGGAPLMILSFYFWNAGSDLQKSQEGLLRSLVSQVLDQDPFLGRILFPEQFLLGADWHDFPTFHELRRAFSRFTASLNGTTKVVMLIDGLDEFDQISLTMTELAEMFIAATRSTHIKAILSSRPLAPFEFSFRQHPKLRLHELTCTDITTYVDEKLAAHPRISELSAEDARGVQELCMEIVDNAAGVFLWVKLVVRSLLEGLQNYDRLTDLRRRLRLLPRDLESLFSHMLHNIPAEYKMESSRMFQIVRSHYANTNFELSALALGLAEGLGVEACEARTANSELSEDITHYIEEQVAGRLRSRCVGLLEIRMRKVNTTYYRFGSYNMPTVPCVDFLHKSVADFLAREDIWAETLRHTQGTDFNAESSLLQSAMQQVKSSRSDLGSGSFLWSNLEHVMAYARFAEMSTNLASLELLDEVDDHMTRHFESIKSSTILETFEEYADGPVITWYDCAAFYNSERRKRAFHDDFISFTIRRGLVLYVEEKLAQIGSGSTQKKGRPLLSYACSSDSHDRFFFGQYRVKIVECLLKNGADPMEVWSQTGETVWNQALTKRLQDPFLWVKILKLLIEYGADPNIHIQYWIHGRIVMLGAVEYIKYRSQTILKDSLSDEWFRHPDYHHEVPMRSHIITEAKAAIEDLIQYMVAHGAKDKHGLLSTKTKQWKSTRNPVKRLMRRLKS